MAELYLGQIIQFAGNFPIQGTALCNGATLSISQNAALFSLLGTTYGGNGTTTFQLPNLQGRVMIGTGQSAGTSYYNVGELGGTENVTLLLSQLPAHTHSVNVLSTAGTTNSPTGNYLASSALSLSPATVRGQALSYATSTDSALAVNAVATSGGSQPFYVLQPYLAVTFLIATQGVFPSRN